jgi:hypothetical protein
LENDEIEKFEFGGCLSETHHRQFFSNKTPSLIETKVIKVMNDLSHWNLFLSNKKVIEQKRFCT